MLTYFSLRLDEKSVKALEKIALKNGVPKSTLARNTLRLVLCERQEPSLVEEVIRRVKRERREELFVKNNRR